VQDEVNQEDSEQNEVDGRCVKKTTNIHYTCVRRPTGDEQNSHCCRRRCC